MWWIRHAVEGTHSEKEEDDDADDEDNIDDDRPVCQSISAYNIRPTPRPKRTASAAVWRHVNRCGSILTDDIMQLTTRVHAAQLYHRQPTQGLHRTC